MTRFSLRPVPGDARRVVALAGVCLLCVIAAGPTGAQTHLPDPTALDAAIRVQRSLVAQDPSDPALLSDLGNLLALGGQNTEALDAYRSALAYAPDDPDILYNLGLLLAETDQFREALELQRRVVEIDPRRAWSHYEIGRLESQFGRRDAAVAAYARAFRLEPDLAFADVNPHAAENPYLTEALLRSGQMQAPPSRTPTPRSYQDPGRIASLLIPPTAASETGDEAPASAEGTPGTTPPPDLPPPDLPVDSATETRVPQAPQPTPERGTGTSEPPDEEPPTQERRTLTTDDLRSLRVQNQATGEAEGSATTTPRGAVRSRPTPRTTPQTSPSRPTPRPPQGVQQPPSSQRFTPNRRSSAQLDVELLPPKPPARPSSP